MRRRSRCLITSFTSFYGVYQLIFNHSKPLKRVRTLKVPHNSFYLLIENKWFNLREESMITNELFTLFTWASHSSDLQFHRNLQVHEIRVLGGSGEEPEAAGAYLFYFIFIFCFHLIEDLISGKIYVLGWSEKEPAAAAPGASRRRQTRQVK